MDNDFQASCAVLAIDRHPYVVGQIKGSVILKLRYETNAVCAPTGVFKNFDPLIRCRQEKLVKIRRLLRQLAKEKTAEGSVQAKPREWRCPKCHQGLLRVQWSLPPVRLTGS